MLDKEIDREVRESLKSFLYVCAGLQVLSVILTIISAIVWIWGDSGIAWKLFLTGISLFSIIGVLYAMVKAIAKKALIDYLDE